MSAIRNSFHAAAAMPLLAVLGFGSLLALAAGKGEANAQGFNRRNVSEAPRITVNQTAPVGANTGKTIPAKGKVVDRGRRPPAGDQGGPRRPNGRGIVVGVPVVTVVPGLGVTEPPVFRGGGPPPSSQRDQPPRRVSGVPPANERRYLPDEIVIEVGTAFSDQAAAALASRHRLVRLQVLSSQLSNSTIFRWRIPDRRSVPAVIRALETEVAVLSAQPNYVSTLQEDAPPRDGVAEAEPAQYAAAKLRLPQAHGLVKGNKILIAVIDSGIDVAHPELDGVIAGRFDALESDEQPHAHGTGIAGAIAAHLRLTGVAPGAQILAIRAFSARQERTEGTTFNILRSLDWAVAHGARIINMSFAGPKDPALARRLAAAHDKGVILIAAAGNAGPKSPPLYPAADANVIAVTATDADDKLYAKANQGRHIAVAAPGVDVYLPSVDSTYQMTSGTSFAAAEVSGAAALMLERKPDLDQATLRRTLVATARDLGPKGIDTQFGAGLIDVYRAVLAIEPSAVESVRAEPAATRE